MTALYRFYDDEDQLLYVGISEHFPRRARQHEDEKPWFDQVVRAAVEHWPTRSAAEEAERLAIEIEQPVFNVVWNVRPKVVKLRWKCEQCKRWVADLCGALELVDATWGVRCQRCMTETAVYWIPIEAVRRPDGLERWDSFVRSKRFDSDWCEFVARCGFTLCEPDEDEELTEMVTEIAAGFLKAGTG
jgi:hypothetical protein